MLNEELVNVSLCMLIVIRRQTLATSTLQPIRALNKSTEIIRAAKLNSGEEHLSSEKPELVPVFMGAALIVSVTGDV